jgi:hypothetical protein
MQIERGLAATEDERKLMNRLVPLRILLLLCLGISSMTWPSHAGADGGCKTIKATMTTVADLAAFTTVGQIRGNLKGTTQFTGDPASLAQMVSQSSPPLNTTFSYTGDLVITTKDGTLTTRSVGVFESVPLGIGTQFDRVMDGTGAFRGATGFLFFHFQANADLTQFTSTIAGELCLQDD